MHAELGDDRSPICTASRERGAGERSTISPAAEEAETAAILGGGAVASPAAFANDVSIALACSFA